MQFQANNKLAKSLVLGLGLFTGCARQEEPQHSTPPVPAPVVDREEKTAAAPAAQVSASAALPATTSEPAATEAERSGTLEIPPEILELPPREERITHQGNPEVGTIYHVKSAHWRPEPGFQSLSYLVGVHQAFMVEEFFRLKPAHILAESWTKDQAPGNPESIELVRVYMGASRHDSELTAAEAQKLLHSVYFPNGVRGPDVDFNELIFVGLTDSLDIYAAMNPEVRIHRSITPEEEAEISPIIEADAKKNGATLRISPEVHDLVFSRRNKAAMRCAMELLGQPGMRGKVILTNFGEGHTFGPENFDPALVASNQVPRIIEVRFPRTIALLNHYRPGGPALLLAQANAISSEQDDAKQLELIKAIPLISFVAFRDIRSEEGQLLALDKLVNMFGQPLGSQSEYMMAVSPNALTDAVRERIAELKKDLPMGLGIGRGFIHSDDLEKRQEALSLGGLSAFGQDTLQSPSTLIGGSELAFPDSSLNASFMDSIRADIESSPTISGGLIDHNLFTPGMLGGSSITGAGLYGSGINGLPGSDPTSIFNSPSLSITPGLLTETPQTFVLPPPSKSPKK